MNYLVSYLIIGSCFIGCNNADKKLALNTSQINKISCNQNGCKGTYEGKEFVNGADVAHQFSNEMAHEVGNKLKMLYKINVYKKVDFQNISMSTIGMGSGDVTYSLSIPFIKVNTKCDAFTSFDHVGGWNHKPSLAKRKQELNPVLMVGKELIISDLKTTPEGLQEYWIQWKNKNIQADCK